MSDVFRVYQKIILKKGGQFNFNFEIQFLNDFCDFEIDTEDVERVLAEAFFNYLNEVRKNGSN